MIIRGLNSLYHWTLTLAERPWALWALVIIAFCESSFFPLPPDLLLIPLVLGAMDLKDGRRVAWWVYPLACTLASVAGGAFGYWLGATFMETFGQWFIDRMHYQDRFDQIVALQDEYGVAIVLTAGLTPLPYKLFTIASGATGMNLAAFLGASFVARGLRFFALSILLRIFGARIRKLLDEHFGAMMIAAAVVVVGGFLLYRAL